MKNKYLSAVLVGMMALSASSTVLSGSQEINVRQNIGNGSMNKIAGARLQGMFADAPKETVESTKEFGRNGCVTSIGSQQSGSSLLDQPQDVVINGDITNVCF